MAGSPPKNPFHRLTNHRKTHVHAFVHNSSIRKPEPLATTVSGGCDTCSKQGGDQHHFVRVTRLSHLVRSFAAHTRRGAAVHTRPRLRHHTNPEKPTRSGLLSYGTLNAGQTPLTTDQKVGSSNLSGRAGQVPRFGGGSAGFGHESDAGRRRRKCLGTHKGTGRYTQRNQPLRGHR